MEAVELARLKADTAFIEKVAALGEHDRAARMARHLLSRISPMRFEHRNVLDVVITLRQLLIDQLELARRSTDNDKDILQEVYSQSEILVDDLLLRRDIHRAVRLLGQLADEGEYEKCWDCLNKITIDLGQEIDGSIIHDVCTAFDKIIDICRDRGNDQEFRSQSYRFAHYLAWKFVDAELVCGYLSSYNDWYADDGYASLLLEMVDIVKRSRGEEFGYRLNGIEGDCYFYLGQHKRAISLYIEAVLYEERKAIHTDYLIWAAQALTALDQGHKVDMFANEVIRLLREDNTDSRVRKAKELCPSFVSPRPYSGKICLSQQQYRVMRVEAVWGEVVPVVDDKGLAMLEFAKIAFETHSGLDDCMIATVRLILFEIDPQTNAKKVFDIHEQDVVLGRVPLPTVHATLSRDYVDAVRHFERTARERLASLDLNAAKPFDFCSWRYAGATSPWVPL